MQTEIPIKTGRSSGTVNHAKSSVVNHHSMKTSHLKLHA